MKRVSGLLVLLAALAMGACGPEPKTAAQVCGPTGCDGCIGLSCDAADAGVDGGR